MPPKKLSQKKSAPKPTHKQLHKTKSLKGGLSSQDSDDTTDDTDDNTTDEQEDYNDEVSENTLNDDAEDEDKLDGNRDVDDEEDTEDEDEEEDNNEYDNANDKCAYKSIIKIKHDADSDTELFDEDIGEKDTFKYKIKKFYIERDEYISKNILTKYERVRVLAVRTANLSAGAKPMIKNIKNLTYREIAKLELKNKKMPFIIERQFSDGSTEVWDVNELEVIN